MRTTERLIALVLPLSLACSSAPPRPTQPPAPPPAPKARVETPPAITGEVLAFDIVEGDIHNHFFRQGPVAAHLLASSGKTPRLLVAFPAGNAGIGLWFDELATPARFDVEGSLSAVSRLAGMRGVSAVLRSEARELKVRAAVLGSIRTLRDFIGTGKVPDEVRHQVVATPQVAFRRTGVDGKHHLELVLEPQGTTRARVEGDRVVLTAAEGEPLRVRALALQDDPPLTPIPLEQMLAPAAADAPRDRQALAFLTYREKMLAGSWRFLTYFGRDTLLSTRLLMPALRPETVEAALGSVLERLAEDGDVAHEEDIGDFAALRNLSEQPRPADLRRPIYDYKMVDDDFLLAPVLVEYLRNPECRERAEAFFARKTPDGRTYAEALRRNLDLVMRRAKDFADKRDPSKLVAIREGLSVGNWRDSNEGLGWGRFPFDVNAALVPAALKAAAELLVHPLLGADAKAAAEASRLAKAWSNVEELFRVELSQQKAVQLVNAYAKEQQIDGKLAAASLRGKLVFRALSLDAKGKPVPVMHSDDGFMLLFGEPAPQYLEEVAGRILRPFPAGLRTPVGVVVANPFAADAKLKADFSRGHYHGTVVWSWQQAMLAAGLERQLARTDLPAATITTLRAAQAELWRVILANAEQRTGELWTWEPKEGRIALVPFGQGSGHHDESNAAQLWSTVYLAVKPPKGLAVAPALEKVPAAR